MTNNNVDFFLISWIIGRFSMDLPEAVDLFTTAESLFALFHAAHFMASLQQSQSCRHLNSPCHHKSHTEIMTVKCCSEDTFFSTTKIHVRQSTETKSL